MRTIRPVLAALLACSAASAQTPADVSTIMASAERQRQAGDSGAALAALEDAAAAYPGQALPLFNLGAVYGELGRYEEAAGALRRGLALDPGNADAHLTLAKARIGLHDYAGALDSAGRYAEIAGAAASNFDFHYVRGVGLRRLARLDEAEAELRKAVALNGGHADALYNLGFVCSRRGRYNEARALLENARRIDPESQDIRYRLAAVLKKLGETAAAARELDAFREAKETRAAANPCGGVRRAGPARPARRRCAKGERFFSAGHPPRGGQHGGAQQPGRRLRQAGQKRLGRVDVRQGNRSSRGLRRGPCQPGAHAGGAREARRGPDAGRRGIAPGAGEPGGARSGGHDPDPARPRRRRAAAFPQSCRRPARRRRRPPERGHRPLPRAAGRPRRWPSLRARSR